jgi:hypothetical protein
MASFQRRSSSRFQWPQAIPLQEMSAGAFFKVIHFVLSCPKYAPADGESELKIPYFRAGVKRLMGGSTKISNDQD